MRGISGSSIFISLLILWISEEFKSKILEPVIERVTSVVIESVSFGQGLLIDKFKSGSHEFAEFSNSVFGSIVPTSSFDKKSSFFGT